MTSVIIYILIGLIIAFLNNHLWSKLQDEKEKLRDNPAMIIALLGWILFWPIGLLNTFQMLRELCRPNRKK